MTFEDWFVGGQIVTEPTRGRNQEEHPEVHSSLLYQHEGTLHDPYDSIHVTKRVAS